MRNNEIRINSELEAKAKLLLGNYGICLNTAYNYILEKIINKEISAKEIQLSSDNENNPKYFKDLCGIWKDQVWMADDFNDPLDDLKDYME